MLLRIVNFIWGRDSQSLSQEGDEARNAVIHLTWLLYTSKNKNASPIFSSRPVFLLHR